MKTLNPNRPPSANTTRVPVGEITQLEIDIANWKADLLNQRSKKGKIVPLPREKQLAIRRRYELRDDIDGAVINTDDPPCVLYDTSETFRRYVKELMDMWAGHVKTGWIKEPGLVDSRLVASICIPGQRQSKNPNATPGWFIYKKRESDLEDAVLKKAAAKPTSVTEEEIKGLL